ncbi:hypothetical protein [Hymenobacter yonginensis]|uniref:Lipoprotein n=1 Tax=Hymenobacter yonginensis TaxID=748197 RepID=A0ABY7PN13_9BACT|nr:hypothetical protein [Hymenobacter yonginensis]WBO84121.1 hypothetical protein O9Z63_17300 [Hymenobacter yonginensis]
MKAFLAAICLLSVMLCSGCNSETESAGINAVLGFYGGQVSYSKGVKKTTEEELQGRYYEIKLSGVEEKMKQHFFSLKLPASNCAYLFYHALAADEKAKYSFVRVIIQGDKTSSQYDFPIDDLAKAEKSALLAERAAESIKTGNYDALLSSCNPEAAPMAEWRKMGKLFQQIDNAYGKVQQFSLQGFDCQTSNLAGGVRHLVRLSGVLVRDKQSTDFSLMVDPSVSAQGPYLYGLTFQK